MPIVFGTMHLGPDCKLYTFGLNKAMGSVINSPNLPGLACNFLPFSFPVSNLGEVTQYGGPNYIQSWFKDPTYVEPVIAANFSFSTVCLPAPITFSNTSTTIGECPPYLWNFGDAASGASNTSTLTSPSHIFSSPGTYTVSLTLKERCQTSIRTKTLTVYGVPTASIVADSTVCDFFGVSLSTISVGTYSWTGPSGNMLGVFTSTLQNPVNPVLLDAHDNEGWYYLTVTNAGGCSAKDSMFINIIEVPTPNVASSIVNCLQTLTVTVGSSNGPIVSYAWGPAGGSALGTTSVITLPIGYPGPQVVAFVVDSEGCGAGFILLTPPLLSPTLTALSSNNLNCTVLSSTLTGTSAGNTMLWNGGVLVGATNPAIVSVAGIYTVTSTNTLTGCKATSTVAVTSNTTLPIVTSLSSGSLTCVIPTSTLTGTSAGNTMLWNGGALVGAVNPAIVTVPGVYTVTH